MNIRTTICTALLVSLGAGPLLLAQEKKEEVRHGDRVTVILNSDEAFTGILIRLDSAAILLDTTYETGGYTSSVGFQLQNIKKIVKEAPRTLEEIKRITGEKLRENARLKSELAQVKEAEAQEERAAAARAKQEKDEADKAAKETEGAQKKQKDDDLLKGIDLLKDYPASEGWGQEKLDKLKDQFNTTGVALTEKEKMFLENFDQWKSAKEALEAAVKGETPTQPTITSKEPEPIIEDISPQQPK